MSAYYYQQASIVTGRQMVMLVTIGLHALVITGMMAIRAVPDLVPEVPHIQVTRMSQERPPPVDLPGAPQATLTQAQRVELSLPAPVFPRVPVEEVASRTQISTVVEGPAYRTEATPRSIPAPTALGFEIVRSTDDYYPPLSIQLQEQGIAVVQVCVGPDGAVEGAPVVRSGSGSRRLDAAAVAWAREALRFTPATREGRPVSACKSFRVRFDLR